MHLYFESLTYLYPSIFRDAFPVTYTLSQAVLGTVTGL